MNLQRLFKLSFWALVLATVWFGIGQCSQGRLTDAFAILDDGIREAQKEQERCNQRSYRNFSSYVAVYPGDQAQKKLDDLYGLQQAQSHYHLFLDTLRAQLLAAAGLSADQPLASQMLHENSQVVQQVLLAGQPNAVMQLAERSGNLRAAMLALADSSYWVLASLPVDFTATVEGRYILQKRPGNFQELPLAGALAVLSNLQTAASAGMATALHYCEQRFYDTGLCNWGAYRPMVSARKTYVMADEPYEAEIFFTDVIEHSNVTKIQVDGVALPIKDGIAHFEQRADGMGQRSFRVDITGSSVRQNAGMFYRDTFRITKEFAYEIGTGHPRLHQPESHNYLYAGVENSISINAWDGLAGNDINIVAAGAVLKKVGGGYFTLLPHSLRPVTLKVGAATFRYKVRPLPDPFPILLHPASSATISRDLLTNQTALHTGFPEDFDFQVDCPVVHFHLTRFRPREEPAEANNRGGEFGQQVQELLQTVHSGDRVLFDDICVRCPGDQRLRNIGALSLRVQ